MSSKPLARRWAVRPDDILDTRNYGEVPVVSREAMGAALADGESFLAQAGGILTVYTERHPTDLRGEAVTTLAIVEWKPSPNAEFAPQPAPVKAYASDEEVEEARVEPVPEDDAEPEPDPQRLLDHDEDEALARLEEEDMDSIPEHAR